MMKASMIEWASQHVPIVALVARESISRAAISSIVEHVIIAIVTATIALYTSNAVHDTQIKQLVKEVQALTATVNEMKRDLYVPRTLRIPSASPTKVDGGES